MHQWQICPEHSHQWGHWSRETRCPDPRGAQPCHAMVHGFANICFRMFQCSTVSNTFLKARSCWCKMKPCKGDTISIAPSPAQIYLLLERTPGHAAPRNGRNLKPHMLSSAMENVTKQHCCCFVWTHHLLISCIGFGTASHTTFAKKRTKPCHVGFVNCISSGLAEHS